MPPQLFDLRGQRRDLRVPRSQLRGGQLIAGRRRLAQPRVLRRQLRHPRTQQRHLIRRRHRRLNRHKPPSSAHPHRDQADTPRQLAQGSSADPRLPATSSPLRLNSYKTDADLCVAPALLDVAGPRTTIIPIAGLPLLKLDAPEFIGMRRLIKSTFDRVIAAVALVLLLPLFILLAMAIKLDDGGPVLFRQTRAGKDGEAFTLYKFRTMVVDAERRRAMLSEQLAGSGLLFKMRMDPRITKVGGFLRRYTLDELPQLINVFIGNMSLVGPRPALPEEAVRYADYVRRRLAVKPGITGLWQINGRSDLSWDEAVRLDLRYVENWSLALDLQILWKTWSAVIGG